MYAMKKTNNTIVKKILLFTGISAALIALLKVLFDYLKNLGVTTTPPTAVPQTLAYATASTGSSSTGIKTQQLVIAEVGQTQWTVTGFPSGAVLGDFDLWLNNEPLVNGAVVTDVYDFTIQSLGGGTYKVIFSQANMVLNPATHTLILKLR
jgi:hypothetical protein